MKNPTMSLELGEENSKYFHQFSNFRKNVKTIKDIKIRVRSIVRSFNVLTTLGVRHFEETYEEPDRENVAEIVKVATFFPQMET